MKKFLLLFFALAFVGVVCAKDMQDDYSSGSIKNALEYSNDTNPYDYLYRTTKKYAHTQGVLSGDTLIRIGNNNLQHLFGPTTPICYDPSSNLLSIAMITFHFDTSGAFQGTTMWNLRTTDDGTNWDSNYVYRDPNNSVAPMRPSVVNTNPTKSENIEDVNTVVYGWTNYKNSGSGWSNADAGGGVFAFYSKDFGTEYVPQKYNAPELGGNTNDPQNWAMLSLSSNSEANKIYAWGTLNPIGDNSQYGYYGFYGFDFATQASVSNNPEQWWTKHFRDAGQKGSSYNAPISVGHDEQGKMYAVIENFFADDDQSRYVAFSTSTDDGANWTDFERMPRTVYVDFVSKYGTGYTNWSVPGLTAYQSRELFVRGVNDFSLITRLLVYGDDQATAPARYFIVDIRYNKGNWSIKEIQELNSYGPTTFYKHTSSTDDTLFLGMTPALSNQSAFNYQISKTADGKNLVLYWLDAVANQYTHFAPFNVYQSVTDPLSGQTTEQFLPIDSLEVTDIFFKIYNIDTDTWRETVNLTNDEKGQYIFNVPEYIKDLEHASILTYETDMERYKDLIIPKPILEVYKSFWPYMFYSSVDIANINSVEEQELGFEVSLNDAYPNPAVNTNSVEISFNMERPSVVSLNIFDNIGNKVATVLNNHYASMGSNGVNYDISNLNSGTYFYQLNVNGHTFTKKLMIAK